MQDKTLIFPKDFVWGVATSSYQIEGGVKEGGRGESIWDVFCRKSGAIHDRSNGDIATGHYKKWKEDIALMRDLGIKAYRFSIAWPRIFPTGREKANQEGIAFYDALIDELLKNGIEPFITLYHWDLPQALQDIGGWLSRNTVKAFALYSKIVFEQYQDRVKNWITINEPWVVAELGYKLGLHAPGLAHPDYAAIVGHHLLLAHGLALQEMRNLATPFFKGKIGISLNLSPVVPENNSKEVDRRAAKQYDEFLNQFFLNGLFKGCYPQKLMEDLSGIIEPNDLEIICKPIDFLGINYYSRTIIQGFDTQEGIQGIIVSLPNAYSTMWEFYPQGLKEVIENVWQNYHPKEIFITENGTVLDDRLEQGKIVDSKRIDYIKAHLAVLYDLLQNKIPIKGYFVWTFQDNFEWSYGYQKRFGLVYTDFKTLERIPKASAYWYGNVSKTNSL